MATIPGKYQLTKSENFDEYMKAIGVGMIMRKIAANLTPVIDITKTDEDWIIKTTTSFKTTEIKFQLGQEFDEETADGRKCKSKITLEDNKFVQTQNCNGSELKILREFTDSEMKLILEAPGATCTRYYKKL